jgi:hypothetical protein
MRPFWARLAQLNAPLLAAALREAARQIELLEPGPPVAIFPPLFEKEGVFSMGQITVKDSDGTFTAALALVDAKGSPTEPNDVPQWVVADETVATVAVDADGKTATFTPGSPGAAEAATTQVTVTSVDADGTAITAIGSITVTAGAAVLGDVTFAAPAPVPPPEPPPAP